MLINLYHINYDYAYITDIMLILYIILCGHSLTSISIKTGSSQVNIMVHYILLLLSQDIPIWTFIFLYL